MECPYAGEAGVRVVPGAEVGEEKFFILRFSVIVLLGAGTLLGCAATTPGPTCPEQDLDVLDIQDLSHTPTGLLGKPLGTRVVVEEECARR